MKQLFCVSFFSQILESSLVQDVVEILDVGMKRAKEVDGRELPEGVGLICALTATEVSLRLIVRSRSILYGGMCHTARAANCIGPDLTTSLDIQSTRRGRPR